MEMGIFFEETEELDSFKEELHLKSNSNFYYDRQMPIILILSLLTISPLCSYSGHLSGGFAPLQVNVDVSSALQPFKLSNTWPELVSRRDQQRGLL